MIILGGCPGTGKTTISESIGRRYDGSVVIETDHFFDYLVSPIDPSMPDSKLQNETVVKAYAESAGVYRYAGYKVILEGVIGPWMLPILTKTLGSFHYIILHTTLERALDRVRLRDSKAVSLGKVERMHPQFEKTKEKYRNHIVDTSLKTVEDITEEVVMVIDSMKARIGPHNG